MTSSYSNLKSLKEPLYLNKGNIPSVLIREIQSILKEGNYYLGEINGYLDDRLFTAFREFKRKSYLEYPDVLGKTTVVALLELVDEAKHPIPLDVVAPKSTISKGKSFKLPTGETVYCDQRIGSCEHFTWGEATKNGTRIPSDTTIVNNIVRHARYLELVRTLLGNRLITTNSWFRPVEINRLVGGVSNSTHILGFASDITVEGIPPLEVYRKINNWHGARGGLGRSSEFTHLDERGYYARWEYGNA